jgi:hypothetical protein
MADTVNLEDLAVEEIGTISQSTYGDGAMCLRVDLIKVDFDELLERLVGQFGYDELMEKIMEKYS